MLRWIDQQADTMRSRIERWCAINSHWANTAGLERLSHDVAGVLNTLGPTERLPTPPWE